MVYTMSRLSHPRLLVENPTGTPHQHTYTMSLDTYKDSCGYVITAYNVGLQCLDVFTPHSTPGYLCDGVSGYST